MIIYSISVPGMSKAYNRFFFKNLEVLEIDYDEENDYGTIINVHEYKNMWSKTPCIKVISTSSIKIRDEPVSIDLSVSPKSTTKRMLFFSDLVHAKISILLLIKNLKATAIENIEKLLERAEKSIPEIELPEQELKRDYPEYFI